MSENKEAKTGAEAAPAAAPAKGSFLGSLMKIVVPAALAAAAAYGGSRTAAAHGAAPVEHHEAKEIKPPGPTMTLDGFLVTIQDANKKSHPMKVTLAVEFDALTKEDAIKAFVPRLRDTILAHLRALSYEDATDGAHQEKLRAELLERVRSTGASTAEKILVTDFVVQ